MNRWKYHNVAASNTWAVIQEGDKKPVAHVQTETEAWNLINLLNYYTRVEQRERHINKAYMDHINEVYGNK